MNLEIKVFFFINRFLIMKINLVFFFIKFLIVVELIYFLISIEYYNEKINELYEREKFYGCFGVN